LSASQPAKETKESKSNMSQTEIRIGGFGGQGVIMCGMILGRAGCIFDNKYATLTQSFGPEARGGACSVQVILSDDPVLYPYVTHPDILTVMSQEAADKFVPGIINGGKIIIEEDLVELNPVVEGVEIYRVPATRLAEQIGRKIVQNIVMVGFITAVTELLPMQAVRNSVKKSVPTGTQTINLLAFDKGYNFGLSQKENQPQHQPSA
jgi:2-oxoglutarate ferredoxin oxidoreductase subunit gamma